VTDVGHCLLSHIEKPQWCGGSICLLYIVDFYLGLNIFGKAARLWVGPTRVWIPQETRNSSLFLKCPDQLWGLPSLQFNGYQVSCHAVNWPEHDLTTHLHLLPGLRMSGAMPLLPLYASMAWKGETLLYNGSRPKFQAW